MKPNAEGDVGSQTRNNTQRYEEAALAFDEQPPLDAPTFVGHALPSEVTPVVPLEEPQLAPESALPPDYLEDPGNTKARVRISRMGLVWALVLVLGLLAAWVAALTR
jgi:hypothetical protein